MDQSFPPWPALFLRPMLILKPSTFRKLFSKLWVTHPILQPFSIFDGGFDLVPHAIGRRRPKCDSASLDQEHGKRTLLLHFYAGCRRNAKAFWRNCRDQALVLTTRSLMRFQGASRVRLAQRQARQSFTHSPLFFNSCSCGASGGCCSDEGAFIFGAAIVTSGAGD